MFKFISGVISNAFAGKIEEQVMDSVHAVLKHGAGSPEHITTRDTLLKTAAERDAHIQNVKSILEDQRIQEEMDNWS